MLQGPKYGFGDLFWYIAEETKRDHVTTYSEPSITDHSLDGSLARSAWLWKEERSRSMQHHPADQPLHLQLRG